MHESDIHNDGNNGPHWSRQIAESGIGAACWVHVLSGSEGPQLFEVSLEYS